MEIVVAQVIAVLAKVAVDKGEALLKEAGEAAAGVARRLASTVIERLKGDPAGAVIADGFQRDPKGYEAPAKDQLQQQVEADPAFGQQLKVLLAQFEQAAPASYQAIVGSGALAIDHSAAASGGSAAASDGSSAWVGTPTPPTKAPELPSEQ